MNKKRDTYNDSKRKKRCKSKSTNNKKWERLAGYYKECETRRWGEGHVTRLRIKALAALLSEIYPSATPDRVRMIPHVVCLADREFRCHSYRQHVSYLQTHQGTLRMYGLKTVPSKSCLHHAATVIADYGWLHEIMEWQAGTQACGSLRGDSTGVAIDQYADWENAKGGLTSRREFVKLHVMVDIRGRKIVSRAVTIGRAHDSPVFREMFERVPDGTGCVMLDAGYDATKNYRMIRDAGRRPVICTRKNHVAGGFGPRAEMIRWQEKNPEEFETTYHRRSMVRYSSRSSA